MNKDLKDFIEKKKAEYTVQFEKWRAIKKENMDKVVEAEKKIDEFRTLHEEILEDEKLWKLS